MNPKNAVRKVLPKAAIKGAEETYRKGRIYALQAKYGFPARSARVIAVTGTNGKTTTCNYINAMLKSAGFRTAMFTTANIELNGELTENTIHRTVPLTADLLRFFKRARDERVDFVILEVTSQALHQHKLLGIPVEVAVMTNLTQDHLDYHGSMEAYAAAKSRLFTRYCNPKAVVLNRDDEWYPTFAAAAIVAPLTYGQHETSNLQLSSVKLSPKGGEAAAQYAEHTFKVFTPLLGQFNVYNAAAAAATGLSLHLTPEQVSAGVAALQAVPGRMEQIEAGQPFDVIVDYAHTPDALKNVLTTLKQITKGQVRLVFGATGDRDTLKRPIMGAIAAEFADAIYLTDDETYTEDPDSIRQAVLAGITETGGEAKTVVIADRTQAIKAAFKDAKAGDIVLLAGIGHQDYRAMGGKNEPWDERQIARNLLHDIDK